MEISQKPICHNEKCFHTARAWKHFILYGYKDQMGLQKSYNHSTVKVVTFMLFLVFSWLGSPMTMPYSPGVRSSRTR